jgi:PTH1 family peptidyl-tRNA hydrolase
MPAPELRLIVGLGNPGPQYDNTPHNIGFEVVDGLARRLGAGPWTPKPRHKCVVAEVPNVASAGGRRPILLMKPTTYMNLSGEAAVAWARRQGWEPEQILVIGDDINLELGRIRLRERGSSGGQKGLKHIIQMFGSEEVPRLRLGIRPMGVAKVPDLSKFVLHKWWGVARDVAHEAVELAIDAAVEALRSDVPTAMNRFNGERIDLEPK